VSGRSRVEWVLLALLPCALAVWGAQLLVAFSLIPQVDMNASRVVPSVALAKGYDIYAGPTDGPVIDFMYGPVGALAFLPAALAGTPSGALLIAGLLNVLLFFAPIAWLHLGVRAVSRPIALAGLATFALLAALDGGLSFSAFTIHVDAPALALCATAAGLVIFRSPGAGHRRLMPSAACAAIAVWTKQTMLPIVVALPLWLLITDGPRAARRHVVWTAAFGAGLAVLFVAWFGYDAMRFNMVTLPRLQPWYGEAEGHGRLPAALTSLRLLLTANRGPAALLAVVAAVAVRDGGGARDWWRAQPWTLLLLVGLLMVPMSVLGGAKLGGYLNTHSPTNYFVLGAATLGLSRLAGRRPSGPMAMLLAALLCLLVGRYVLDAHSGPLLQGALARLRAWSDNPQQQAYEFARQHPGEAYFPWNPLAPLQANGVLFHSEIGMWNRELTGVEPTPEHVRRFLPPDARIVASRPPTSNLSRLPPANHHLPQYSRLVTEPGLEGWEVRARE